MTVRRIAASLVAALAASGVLLHFVDLLQAGRSAVDAVWTMLRFFTIRTNLLALALFTRSAADRRAFHRLQWEAGVALALLLVGLVYALVLQGLVELTPLGIVANALVHQATPAAAALFWLFLTRKGALTFRLPWLWALYPLTGAGRDRRAISLPVHRRRAHRLWRSERQCSVRRDRLHRGRTWAGRNR
nr:Pr6Pr family membrane protein [Allosphingosinicella indica]